MQYRAYVTDPGPAGRIAVEPVGDDYEEQEGDALFEVEPSLADLEAAFPVENLDAEKRAARALVSAAAEQARLRFVTPGSAKAMAYQEKAREAVEFLADDPAGQADPLKYPLIHAEVGATAEDAAGVAAVVAAKYQAFRLIEARIGGAEAAAQKAIAAAETVAAVDAVVAGLTWPAAPADQT
jgi:hypothetical protein